MSNMINLIEQHSARFLPAFARLPVFNDGQVRNYPALDLHLRDMEPHPAPGEVELKRFMVVGGCMFTVSDSGTPIDPANGVTSGRMVKLFYGGADILLTDRRLLATVVKGETVLGDVGGTPESILALSFPLERVESISIDLRKKLLGGVKENRLHIMCTTGTATDLFIDDIVAEPGTGPRGYQRYSGTKRDILEALVPPVIATRWPSSAPAERAQLTAVEDGQREETANAISVDFVTE